MSAVDNTDYRRLLEFRTNLRRFLRWSEEAAEDVGITPAQHQLLLAVRGHADPDGPTIKDTAGYLLARHNSVVELVDRAHAAGLIQRVPDRDDHRVVHLRLTAKGHRMLEVLSQRHLDELARIGPTLGSLIRTVDSRPIGA